MAKDKVKEAPEADSAEGEDGEGAPKKKLRSFGQSAEPIVARPRERA